MKPPINVEVYEEDELIGTMTAEHDDQYTWWIHRHLSKPGVNAFTVSQSKSTVRRTYRKAEL